MKNKREKIVKKEHPKYDNFLLKQYIIDLDIGDKIVIQTFDKDDHLLDTKEYIAQYKNCHINATWQDKDNRKKKDEM